MDRPLRVIGQLLDVIAVDQLAYFGLVREHGTLLRLSLLVGRDPFRTRLPLVLIRVRQVGNLPTVGLLTRECFEGHD